MRTADEAQFAVPPRHALRLRSVTGAQSGVSAPVRERLLSLDAFRGITIAAMILVNNPGTWEHTYKPLQHARWNGCTPTDLIFPFFLFIVGVAIKLSLGESVSGEASLASLTAKIMRRTVTIFALGIFLNGFPLFDWSALRIPGVLQRIAVCYGLAGVLVLRTGVRAQIGIVAALLIAYCAVSRIVPGAVGPVGPETNLGAYIDRALLQGHLLHDGWDPEGILSTVAALATTLCGVITGDWLRSARSTLDRVAGLFVAGDLALVLGLTMNIWIPINKSLWSSSYVVFTAGVALNVLAVCYWLVDFKGYQAWAKPFVMYGTNPIVAYVLSSLMAKVMFLGKVTIADGSKIDLQRYVFDHVFLPFARPVDASFLYALVYVLLWLGITAFLYRNRIIIKI